MATRPASEAPQPLAPAKRTTAAAGATPPAPAGAAAGPAAGAAATPPAPAAAAEPRGPLLLAVLACVLAIACGFRVAHDTLRWYDVRPPPPGAPPPTDAGLDPHFAAFLSDAVFDALTVGVSFNWTDPRGGGGRGPAGWVAAGPRPLAALASARRAAAEATAPLYAACAARRGLRRPFGAGPWPSDAERVSLAYAGCWHAAQFRTVAARLPLPADRARHARLVGAAVAAGAERAPSGSERRSARGAALARPRGAAAELRADADGMVDQMRRVGLFQKGALHWATGFDAAWTAAVAGAAAGGGGDGDGVAAVELHAVAPLGGDEVGAMGAELGYGASRVGGVPTRGHAPPRSAWLAHTSAPRFSPLLFRPPPHSYPASAAAPRVVLWAVDALLRARHGARLAPAPADAAGWDGVTSVEAIAVRRADD